MNATSAALWHDAAELGDNESDDSWNGMPRCPSCGCFLTMKSEDQGFDTVRGEYYESRICKRCTKVVSKAVW